MTLKEKIMQLNQYTEGDNDTPNNIEKSVNELSPEVGSLIFSSSDPVFRNKIQKKAVEESRLGIPILFAFDVIHGYKTIYPIPLGQAASWNLDLAKKASAIAAKESRLGGIEWTFSPMIDVAYDPRWGRVSEGYGEDPYTNAQFSVATILGYQGTQPYDSLHVAACLKHYIGYSRSEGGRDYVYTDISPQSIWETYIPPYIATINAGAATLMSSFNDISGIPSTANTHWLKDVLRTQLGFNGLIVSDWYGIDQLKSQGVAKDDKEAGLKAFLATTDVDMVDNIYGRHLEELVKEKKITIAQIDDAVRRILKLKFELGLFEKPYVHVLPDDKRFLLPEDIKTVEKYAEETMVLLKNKDQVLPLESVKNIALIGPFAKDNDHVMGSWRGFGKTKDVVPFYEGMIKEFGSNVNFEYVRGCDFEGDDKSEFDAAYQAALKSDIVVLYLGEKAGWSGENASRSSLALPQIQEDLIKHVATTGKKIILVFSSGRPIELALIEPLVDGIIAIWQPGTAGSAPLAGILSGRINPSGKLPITFPYSTGQIPTYYNHKQSARVYQGHYQDVQQGPLYPFAYSLSYTTFEYSDIKLSKDNINKSDKLVASITVKNTGKKDGLETVHWFIPDWHASISRPVKELKHFERN
ncbi:glycoside hydrolase family 3 N-terminal domain-containing protein [Sphingobacterium sp. SGL-16]|uniref:glycoside hydrolase family 3 N-terminal domain-containing protein n=1 Tax=Sphingobacterium sp. SGL-16 TaxID=2710883 RepID=UPI0019D06DD8|nr:glycoside hydrolase family 3 N-terminal domain-containing protein [Sphingobacterium sp. SGL-16]